MKTFSGTPHAPFKRPARNYFRRKGGFPCDGCNKTCRMVDGDYYMVHDRIWVDEAGLDKSGCMLCVACLEVRIGRKLVIADLPICPVNAYLMARLDERLGEMLAWISGARTEQPDVGLVRAAARALKEDASC